MRMELSLFCTLTDCTSCHITTEQSTTHPTIDGNVISDLIRLQYEINDLRMSVNKKKALFICLGNICRSPIAEGVFQKTVNDMNLGDQWEIDSAAIGGWHVGNPPDWRAIDTMKEHNVPYDNHARQLTSVDFNHYDFIFGMDEENMRDLKRKAPKGSKAQLLLFGEFDPEGDRIIRDPYYDSDSKGFEKCYQQSVRCSKGFLEHLDKQT